MPYNLLVNTIFAKKIMKKIIEKIYYVNRSWWDSFTSCFIGTILGIGITFGISGYLEKKSNAEMEHTIQLMNIMYMESAIDDFKDKEESSANTDSIFTEVLRYYPDSIDFMPKKLVTKFYARVTSITIAGKDNSIENIFKNNIEVWKAIKDKSDIFMLVQLYSAKEMCDRTVKEMSEIMNKLYNNMIKEKDLENFNSYKEARSYIFKNKENINLIQRYSYYHESLSQIIPFMEIMLERVKKNIGISDKDLESIVAKCMPDTVYEEVEEEEIN